VLFHLVNYMVVCTVQIMYTKSMWLIYGNKQFHTILEDVSVCSILMHPVH